MCVCVSVREVVQQIGGNAFKIITHNNEKYKLIENQQKSVQSFVKIVQLVIMQLVSKDNCKTIYS